jgi:hypothetical protein
MRRTRHTGSEIRARSLSPPHLPPPGVPVLSCQTCAGAGRTYLRPLARREVVSRTAPWWEVEALMRERKRDSRSSAAASSSALSSELLPPRACAHFFRALSPPCPPRSTLPPQSSPCLPNPSRSRPLCVRDDGRAGDEAPAAPALAILSTHRRTSAFAACAMHRHVSAGASARPTCFEATSDASRDAKFPSTQRTTHAWTRTDRQGPHSRRRRYPAPDWAHQARASHHQPRNRHRQHPGSPCLEPSTPTPQPQPLNPNSQPPTPNPQP